MASKDERPKKNHGRWHYASGILYGGKNVFGAAPHWACATSTCHATSNFPHRGFCSVCGAVPPPATVALQVELQAPHLVKRPISSAASAAPPAPGPLPAQRLRGPPLQTTQAATLAKQLAAEKAKNRKLTAANKVGTTPKPKAKPKPKDSPEVLALQAHLKEAQAMQLKFPHLHCFQEAVFELECELEAASPPRVVVLSELQTELEELEQEINRNEDTLDNYAKQIDDIQKKGDALMDAVRGKQRKLAALRDEILALVSANTPVPAPSVQLVQVSTPTTAPAFLETVRGQLSSDALQPELSETTRALFTELFNNFATVEQVFAGIAQARTAAETDIQLARQYAFAQQQLGGGTPTDALPLPNGPAASATTVAPTLQPTPPAATQPAIILGDGTLQSYPINGAGVGIDVARGAPAAAASHLAQSQTGAGSTPDMPIDQSQKRKTETAARPVVESSRKYLMQFKETCDAQRAEKGKAKGAKAADMGKGPSTRDEDELLDADDDA